MPVVPRSWLVLEVEPQEASPLVLEQVWVLPSSWVLLSLPFVWLSSSRLSLPYVSSPTITPPYCRSQIGNKACMKFAGPTTESRLWVRSSGAPRHLLHRRPKCALNLDRTKDIERTVEGDRLNLAPFFKIHAPTFMQRQLAPLTCAPVTHNLLLKRSSRCGIACLRSSQEQTEGELDPNCPEANRRGSRRRSHIQSVRSNPRCLRGM